MTERYLEDFAVGQTFESGRLTVDSNRIKAFAAEFDPPPFHLDDDPEQATTGRSGSRRGSTEVILRRRIPFDHDHQSIAQGRNLRSSRRAIQGRPDNRQKIDVT